MRLGRYLTSYPYRDWRYVDADLYDIHERVQEYDAECRLVRQDGTGQLALARYVPAMRETNVVLRLPLYGEPDARVLRIQGEADAFNKRDLKRWRREEIERTEAAKAAHDNEEREQTHDWADQMAWAMKRDAGVQDQVAI